MGRGGRAEDVETRDPDPPGTRGAALTGAPAGAEDARVAWDATRRWSMGRPHASTLAAGERESIREKTLWVLEHVGVSFPSARALDVLERGGADVDRERRLARLPRALVEQCLATAPGTVLLAGRDPVHDIELGTDRPLVCCADGEGTLVADDATGEIRDATVTDLRDVCRLYDALPEIDFLWTSLSAPSLDPETAPLAVDAIALLRLDRQSRSAGLVRRQWSRPGVSPRPGRLQPCSDEDDDSPPPAKASRSGLAWRAPRRAPRR